MNAHRKAWLAMIMVLGLVLSSAQAALASPPGQPLPPTRTPNSGRFDMAGTIDFTSADIGGFTMRFSGSGAFSGDDLQMDVNLEMETTQPGSPAQTEVIGISMIVVDDKAYYKFTGVSPDVDNQWYVTDLEGQSAMPIAPGMPTTDPDYDQVFSSKQVGKETINGVPTTKYQIDVDLEMLYLLSGSTEEEAEMLAANSSMVMFIWVGDNDMYVHRLNVMYEAADPELDANLSLDFTMNFRDFEAPITITAPPNAIPLESAFGGPAIPMPAGMPRGMPVGMPVGMPRTTGGTGVGMPRTGLNAQQNGQENMPWALVSLALLSIAAGGAIRRRSVRV